MKEKAKNLKLNFAAAAVLYLALGVVLLGWPDTTSNIICYAIGAVLLIYGLVSIISFLASREKTAALADEIAALTLTACVDYDPAEGAAAVCGLDTPEVTLTVNYLADNSAERTLILAIGLSTGDGGRYVALDGDTTIYRMEESSLTQILTLSETGL